MDLINSLPDTIMIEIFGYLTPNMIKYCTLVCKRWDKIIGFSELMGRFQLNLRKSDAKIQEAKELKRKHRSALIYVSQITLDIIFHHNLHTLHIQCYKNLKLSTLIVVLNEFSALKVLAATLTNPIDDILSCDVKSVKANLKELECPVNIIHIFDCKSIKVLKLSWFNPIFGDKKRMLIDFMKQQDNIEDLTINGDYLNDFFTLTGILEFKFALKKLTLANDGDEMKFSNHCTLIRFLDQHKESLTSLELHFCTEPVYGIKLIHNYVLDNLIKLKHIKFGYFCISDDSDDETDDDDDIINAYLFPFDELPHSVRAAKTIESIVMILVENQIHYDRFFALFPNLKHLAFWSKGEETMLQTASYISISHQLETLKLMQYSGDARELNEISYFPHLKEIFIGENWETNLCHFFNRHSNTLEKIIFKDCDDISYETTKSILNCTQLKYLDVSFHNPSVCMISMLNEISFRPGRFTLKVSFSSHKFSFMFPDDKIFYDEELENLMEKIYRCCCAVN